MKTVILLATVLATLFLAGPTPAQTLDDANGAFAAGKFHDSTVAYQALLAKNGFSAPLLFDLGNSYYREGNLAQAILAYQRAQWLAPGDPDIAANLQAAQKAAGLTAPEPRWGDKLAHVMSASQWAWLACAAWSLLCASFLVRAIMPRQANLFGFAAIAGAFIMTTAIAGAVFTSDGLNHAVITDKNATALIAPFPAAQVLFSPAPGETVTIEKAHDDFFWVTDRTGHSGWTNKAQLTAIVQS